MDSFETRTGKGPSTADETRDAAAAKLEEAWAQSSALVGRMETFIRERPATALLIALSAGYLIGRLVRRE